MSTPDLHAHRQGGRCNFAGFVPLDEIRRILRYSPQVRQYADYYCH
jgi:hypothetical protein